MKLKKLIFVLIIPFLLSGCADVNYNLNIKRDLSADEKVFITATTEYFNNFYREFPRTVVKSFYDNDEVMSVLKNNNYSYQMVTESISKPGVEALKKFSNLSEYATSTVFKDQMFEDIKVTTDNNLITIKTNGFLPYVEDETDVRYPISNLNINIKLPYVVTSNNADSYNKKTNTYTWNINSETLDKEINLTFDKSKIYVYNLVMYISIAILCVIGLIIALIVFHLRKRNKTNNKVA